MTLANGSTVTSDILYTQVTFEVKRKSFKIKLLVLPKTKRNRTLLSVDILQKTGIVLNVKNRQWYFNESPRQFFHLYPNNDPLNTKNMPNDFYSCILDEE